MREEPQVDIGKALNGAARDLVSGTARRRAAKSRPTEDVADRLSNSALRLFSERGFDAVTVSDIAEQAGVTSRTFFRYFPSKETVILDILDGMNRRMVELIETTDPQEDALDATRIVLQSWLAEYEELLIPIGELTTQSTALSSMALLRSTEYEDRLAEALRHRYPGLGAQDSQLWAGTVFLIMRLTNVTAVTEGGKLIDLCDEFIQRFRDLIGGTVLNPVRQPIADG